MHHTMLGSDIDGAVPATASTYHFRNSIMGSVRHRPCNDCHSAHAKSSRAPVLGMGEGKHERKWLHTAHAKKRLASPPKNVLELLDAVHHRHNTYSAQAVQGMANSRHGQHPAYIESPCADQASYALQAHEYTMTIYSTEIRPEGVHDWVHRGGATVHAVVTWSERAWGHGLSTLLSVRHTRLAILTPAPIHSFVCWMQPKEQAQSLKAACLA